MTSILLFGIAIVVASAAALLAAYARTGEQETLAGGIALLALLFAAVGGLARVYGI